MGILRSNWIASCGHAATLALPSAQVRDSVAIHVPCSSKKMGIANAFETVASKCAHEVVPTGVPCCGAPNPLDMCGSSSSHSCLSLLTLYACPRVDMGEAHVHAGLQAWRATAACATRS